MYAFDLHCYKVKGRGKKRWCLCCRADGRCLQAQGGPVPHEVIRCKTNSPPCASESWTIDLAGQLRNCEFATRVQRLLVINRTHALHVCSLCPACFVMLESARTDNPVPSTKTRLALPLCYDTQQFQLSHFLLASRFACLMQKSRSQQPCYSHTALLPKKVVLHEMCYNIACLAAGTWLSACAFVCLATGSTHGHATFCCSGMFCTGVHGTHVFRPLHWRANVKNNIFLWYR